jgi:hypothetical protein
MRVWYSAAPQALTADLIEAFPKTEVLGKPHVMRKDPLFMAAIQSIKI